MFDESLPLFSESPPDTFTLINGGEIGHLEVVFAIIQTLCNKFPAPQKEKKSGVTSFFFVANIIKCLQHFGPGSVTCVCLPLCALSQQWRRRAEHHPEPLICYILTGLSGHKL